MDKLYELKNIGQSIWLDNISRNLITSGKLKGMIDKGLMGVTSNPTIFEQAIANSTDYNKNIDELINRNKTIMEIYDELTIKDIQDTADLLLPVYKKSNKKDGYVSLEVNPQLAYNSKDTIKEALRLFHKVQRPNMMIKVPATDEGFSAIEELIAQGININITLIFSLNQYTQAARSYIKGLKRLGEYDKSLLSNLHSVASVFVSRVDTAIDKLLEEKISSTGDNTKKQYLENLKGKAAVANAKRIYQKFINIFSSDEFKHLALEGANTQRVLWASTSTKNPKYKDTKYVEELIGKDTINTIPLHTWEAFLDHGEVKENIITNLEEDILVLNKLKKEGIDIEDVCNKLLREGTTAFKNSFTSLLKTIETKAKKFASL